MKLKILGLFINYTSTLKVVLYQCWPDQPDGQDLDTIGYCYVYVQVKKLLASCHLCQQGTFSVNSFKYPDFDPPKTKISRNVDL